MPIFVPFNSMGARVSARLPNKVHLSQVVTCFSPKPLLSAKLKLSNGSPLPRYLTSAFAEIFPIADNELILVLL